jgi:hypothetical protein
VKIQRTLIVGEAIWREGRLKAREEPVKKG